jgi:hypothetical protein
VRIPSRPSVTLIAFRRLRQVAKLRPEDHEGHKEFNEIHILIMTSSRMSPFYRTPENPNHTRPTENPDGPGFSFETKPGLAPDGGGVFLQNL